MLLEQRVLKSKQNLKSVCVGNDDDNNNYICIKKPRFFFNTKQNTIVCLPVPWEQAQQISIISKTTTSSRRRVIAHIIETSINYRKEKTKHSLTFPIIHEFYVCTRGRASKQRRRKNIHTRFTNTISSA